MSVFFTSPKTGFKSWLDTSSIPCYLSSFFSIFLLQSQQLLDTWWINWEWVCIASRHLVDRSRFCSWFWWVVPRYALDTSAVNDHFSTPSSIGVSIPLNTCICRDLLLALFKLPMQSGTHFIWYLSRYFSVFFPKLSHLLPIFVPQGFFKLFQEFLHLVSF